jgi:hypothetical protein
VRAAVASCHLPVALVVQRRPEFRKRRGSFGPGEIFAGRPKNATTAARNVGAPGPTKPPATIASLPCGDAETGDHGVLQAGRTDRLLAGRAISFSFFRPTALRRLPTAEERARRRHGPWMDWIPCPQIKLSRVACGYVGACDQLRTPRACQKNQTAGTAAM